MNRESVPCGYCFERWATDLDHLKPASYGGSNSPSNLYPACRRCNGMVSDRVFDSIEEKRAWVQEQLRLKPGKREKPVAVRPAIRSLKLIEPDNDSVPDDADGEPGTDDIPEPFQLVKPVQMIAEARESQGHNMSPAVQWRDARIIELAREVSQLRAELEELKRRQRA